MELIYAINRKKRLCFPTDEYIIDPFVVQCETAKTMRLTLLLSNIMVDLLVVYNHYNTVSIEQTNIKKNCSFYLGGLNANQNHSLSNVSEWTVLIKGRPLIPPDDWTLQLEIYSE